MSGHSEKEEIRFAPEEIPETAFYVTADELFLLLYSQKIGMLPLPEGILERVPDEEECANAAIRLVRKGVLSPDGESHLVLEDGVRSFLHTVRDYAYVIFERGSSYGAVPRCLYVCGDSVAELRPDQVQRNSFAIRCLSLKELAEETASYEFFRTEGEDGGREQGGQEEWLPPEELRTEDLLSDERVLLLTEMHLRDQAGPKKMQMILQSGGRFLLVTDTEEGRNIAEFFTKDLFSTVYQP